MSTLKTSKALIITHPNFTIEINSQSGFCFGVVNAILKAEQNLNATDKLYSVGSIVHNSQEVSRLTKKGLEVIELSQLNTLKNKKILFRAHGEPPESYEQLKASGNELIDATCPVVLKIQQRIKKAYQQSLSNEGQIVIYGKENHPEVLGLMGQTSYKAILISSENDIPKIDLTKPIELFSQTTMPLNKFRSLATLITEKSTNTIKVNDTICRQVSDRQKYLKEFSSRFDIVYFVGDKKSSNSKVLFQVCKNQNEESYFITAPDEINLLQLKNKSKIGICGATSTPEWLMQDVAKSIESVLLANQTNA